jgi:hypothetical protein
LSGTSYTVFEEAKKRIRHAPLLQANELFLILISSKAVEASSRIRSLLTYIEAVVLAGGEVVKR